MSLSPVVELIIDIVTSGLGGLGNKECPSFPEGPANASLGAVAAFVGVLAAIFACALFAIVVFGTGFSESDYTALMGASFLVALFALGGRWAGVRAPSVTARHLGLAWFGRGAATLALLMSCISILVGLFRLVRHMV